MSEYRIGDEVHVKGKIVEILVPGDEHWENGIGVRIENSGHTINIDHIKDQIAKHTKVLKEGDRVQWYSERYLEKGVVEAISKDKRFAFINYRGEMKSIEVLQLTRLNDNGV